MKNFLLRIKTLLTKFKVPLKTLNAGTANLTGNSSQIWWK